MYLPVFSRTDDNENKQKGIIHMLKIIIITIFVIKLVKELRIKILRKMYPELIYKVVTCNMYDVSSPKKIRQWQRAQRKICRGERRDNKKHMRQLNKKRKTM